ncbi:MAG TPA: SprT family zinc-dependent metalloprotease, partial [Rectinemataceae bacterium]
TRIEVAHAYAATKLGWIRKQQEKFRAQARESSRQYVERESHYIWGRRYLLSVKEADEKPSVRMTHRGITLTVRPGTSRERRAEIMHEWSKSLLHEAVPDMIAAWEPRLDVSVAAYFLQRMKTKWGGCNPKARHIRLNTELVKKPKDLLEYVIVHEMIHLIEPTHNARFEALLDKHYPSCREARAELNELPLATETWQTELAVHGRKIFCENGIVD